MHGCHNSHICHETLSASKKKIDESHKKYKKKNSIKGTQSKLYVMLSQIIMLNHKKYVGDKSLCIQDEIISVW